jgi:hypothetical protein
MQSLRAVLLAGSAILGAAALLHAETIDVKTGQWESTMTMEMSGMPPIDTSKMSPETRAKVEQAIKARQGAHTSTSKSCVTQESLNKGLDFGQSDSCKKTLITSSRTVHEVKVECTGKTNSTSTLRIEAVSRENVKGTIKSTSSDGAHPMTMNGTFTAKWIGPCPEAK